MSARTTHATATSTTTATATATATTTATAAATATASSPTTGLDLVDVSIRIPLPGTPRRWVYPARDITLSFPAGAITAIVGESGCGKSVLALAATGLLPASSQTSGSILADGVDVLGATERELAAIRGRAVGLVPQSAATHLTPVRTIGSTLAESLAFHGLPAAAADVIDLLRSVELPPDTRQRYPHEVSGGMAQRVLVALTCALEPSVLVADEPTSALDARSAALVRERLRAQADRGAAVVLITHDLVAARGIADRVAVMYAGQILEVGPAPVVLRDPAHDYTRALLAALPENGLVPPQGTPSSLVDPDPQVCLWHARIGVPCDGAPLRSAGVDHLAACDVVS
ncbi:ABC transporter ATP-binding protein [Ornithinimicrobium faecis]|uniref:Nickel import system ATP-binding protein NikD n=1 Tax=Ornithinimicrobium faecis TaxID=2934158 RepID=A0ABY4YXV1_9MICO|nr:MULTISPECIES: ABC transporter ATP-binding protein [unclassified Ornithinimicrobium]USQ81611.1 ABC transporter ATP-binding protein [Ornithinimicrobium sp. HY1793]